MLPTTHFGIGMVTGALLALPTVHFWIEMVTGAPLALPIAHFEIEMVMRCWLWGHLFEGGEVLSGVGSVVVR